jgi:caa(3)-type oxidase subunit IV
MSSAHGQGTITGHEGHEHHVLPLSVYYGVYFALLVLTVLTVAVSFANLGPMSLPAAMFVAVIKAACVAGFFMHLRYDNRFLTLIFACSLLFLAVFFAFTLFDLSARGDFVQEEKTFTAKLQGAATYRLNPMKLTHHHHSTNAIDVLVERRKAAVAAAKAAKAKAIAKKAKPKVAKTPFADYKAPSASFLASAKKLFVKSTCATCHGNTGLGDGPAGKSLPPGKRPRNFHTEKFKNGATVGGIFKTLAQGIPGTLMASFAHLPSKDRYALSKYVRHIYVTARLKKLKKTSKAAPKQAKKAVKVAKAPAKATKKGPFADYKAPSAAYLASAKKLFIQSTCGTCHGNEGKGDGVVAKSLPADKRPRNFHSGKFKNGASTVAIFKTLAKGIPGTLMASFAHLSTEKRMKLAKYVRHIYVTARIKKVNK